MIRFQNDAISNNINQQIIQKLIRMKIVHVERRPSELAYKNFKLPILQVSKPQFCNKVLHDFRKSLEQNKQSMRTHHEPQVKQIMKKLKLVSLIKSDKESLNSLPIYENYCPYRKITRVVQTDFRRINQRNSPVKSHDREKKFRSKTQVKQDLMVSKMNMNINLSSVKSVKYSQDNNFPSQRIRKSHKRSSTEAIHNFKSSSGRKASKLKKKTEISTNNQELSVDLFLTTDGLQIPDGDDEPIDENELLKIKMKPFLKPKFHTKIQTTGNKNSVENQILNHSLRGWTGYGKPAENNYRHFSDINNKQDSFL